MRSDLQQEELVVGATGREGSYARDGCGGDLVPPQCVAVEAATRLDVTHVEYEMAKFLDDHIHLSLMLSPVTSWGAL